MADHKKEIVHVIEMIAEIGKVVEQVLHADSMAAKAMAVLSLSDEFMDLLSLDIAKLKMEFDAMDEKMIDELKTVFDHNFDLQDDLMEEIIEMGFDALIEVGDAIDKCIDLGKKVMKK